MSVYASAERIILLIRAMNTKQGRTWEEITEQVGRYANDPIASQRMFLRDLILLEQLEFRVERDEIKRNESQERKHLYRLVHAERFFVGTKRNDLQKTW